MISPDHIDDSLISEGGDDTMELANNLLDETNSNSEHTEQVLQGDEGDADMEVTPTESAAVKTTAEELSLQETVKVDTKEAIDTSEKDASKEVVDTATSEEEQAAKAIGEAARNEVASLDDLDGYLDMMMMDQTMSIAKAKKGGDLVAIVECPTDDHPVDLITGRGFFLIDCADVARKTMEGMLKYADETQDVVGCAGHPDCTSTLAEAMEHTMLPDELFCYEGHPNHLARARIV